MLPIFFTVVIIVIINATLLNSSAGEVLQLNVKRKYKLSIRMSHIFGVRNDITSPSI